MKYKVVYHPAVVEDIDLINRNIQLRIERAISERLTHAPLLCGKPLAGSLSGYWKMRVGDFRVIYKVVKSEVRVFGIINRRDVYKEIFKRLSWKS